MIYKVIVHPGRYNEFLIESKSGNIIAIIERAIYDYAHARCSFECRIALPEEKRMSVPGGITIIN